MKIFSRNMFVLFFVLLLISSSSPGQENIIDQGDLEAFVDGIMRAHMEANHIAGATFSFVKDGEILFAKGYGYANVEKKIPVKGDETMFRPGSISKLLTWTAVMQLFEQGKLDLDADINIYLDNFKIPDTYPEPITMKHLMTHTPGFEEMIDDMAVRNSEDLWTLEKYVSTNIPARILPPGKLTAYSNYGAALAGYIVQKVSGMPFEDYVEKNIFQPLDMKTSTFRQPLPSQLEEKMSEGYTFKKGVFHKEMFELLNGVAPAGALSSCATDMAHFMIAHLQLGRFGEKRILEEETASLMHSLLFTNHPRVSGNAYGFWELRANNLRAISHGGDTIWFHSFLVLIPEKNTGLFVSYNSVGGGGSARADLTFALLDRYYPAEKADAKPIPDDKKRIQSCAGHYRPTRVVRTNWAKLMALMMNLNFKVTEEDHLYGGGAQWVEVEPYIFQKIGGENRLVFEPDEDGNVASLFIDSNPYNAYVRVSWFEAPPFSYALLAVCGLLFLTALRWPLGAVLRKVCKKRKEENPAPRSFRWVAGSMSILYIIFFIGLALSISDEMKLIFGVPTEVKVLLALPLIAALLTLVALFFMATAWIKKHWTRCGRLHYTLVVLASIATLWFLNFWNLLGYKL
jgi:CubicO group peptidase (beta-lactamase class C family)